MGLIQFCAMVFLLGVMCDIIEGVDDFTVQFESQKTCFEEDSKISLVVEYTGTGTPDIVQWKFSKMIYPDKTLDIVTAFCSASAGADSAFPVSRMNYTCDNTQRKYTTNIIAFNESSDAGTWEVAVSVNSVFTNFKSVTVEKCFATTDVISTSTSTTTPTTSTTTPSTSTTTPNTTTTTPTTSTTTPTTSTSTPTTTTSISTSTTTTQSAASSSSTSLTTSSSAATTTKPANTTSSSNETTVIIVSSVLGGLFLIGIVITIVLMLLLQRRGHHPARNHRHRDQDHRHKRRDHHRYPSWQDHGQYNNTSYIEYPGMSTKINPLYVPYRSAYRGEQYYYLGHPSSDHQSYPRNHQIYYGGHYNNVRLQTDMHPYKQRYYGRRSGNNISSALHRDENNYVAPDFELYW